MALSEERLAMALCGHPGAALACVLAEEEQGSAAGSPAGPAPQPGPRVRHLLGFCLSDEHLSLRRDLGLAREGSVPRRRG
jgi:hypothetical protein